MSNNVRFEDEEETTSYHSYACHGYAIPLYFGPGGGISSTDPSNKKKKTKRDWDSSAPKWRVAARGLSLEGKNSVFKILLNLH